MPTNFHNVVCDHHDKHSCDTSSIGRTIIHNVPLESGQKPQWAHMRPSLVMKKMTVCLQGINYDEQAEAELGQAQRTLRLRLRLNYVHYSWPFKEKS